MKVTRYQKVGSDSLIAYVSFHIPQWDLYLSDCKLILGKNGQQFIAYPSKSYQKDGETKYSPYFCFGKEMHERFQKNAREAIEKYAAEQAQESTLQTEVPF